MGNNGGMINLRIEADNGGCQQGGALVTTIFDQPDCQGNAAPNAGQFGSCINQVLLPGAQQDASALVSCAYESPPVTESPSSTTPEETCPALCPSSKRSTKKKNKGFKFTFDADCSQTGHTLRVCVQRKSGSKHNSIGPKIEVEGGRNSIGCYEFFVEGNKAKAGAQWRVKLKNVA